MSDDLDNLAASQSDAWKTSRPRRLPRKVSAPSIVVNGLPECPHWVPADLVKEWNKVAASKDEYAAAAHVRELKRRRLK